MNVVGLIIVFVLFQSSVLCSVRRKRCARDYKPVCEFVESTKSYKLHSNKCIYEKQGSGGPLSDLSKCVVTRRVLPDPCPMFCQEHYRPVCGVSISNDYVYRSFKNACYFDMVNCRGTDGGYMRVPLEMCPRHGAKNLFKSEVFPSYLNDNLD